MFWRPCSFVTRFNKIAIQETAQMAVDKEARAYRESTHIVILSVTCSYTKYVHVIWAWRLYSNGYIAELPETNSKEYGNADDLALLKVHQEWNTIEETLTQDVSILSYWLNQWRPKLSEAKTVSPTFHLNNREAKRELNLHISGRRLTCHKTPTYLGVKIDRTLTYSEHLTALRGKVMVRTALIRRLAGTSWEASTLTLRTSTLALVYAPSEYFAPVWCRSSPTRIVDVGLNASLRTK